MRGKVFKFFLNASYQKKCENYCYRYYILFRLSFCILEIERAYGILLNLSFEILNTNTKNLISNSNKKGYALACVVASPKVGIHAR